MMDLQTAIDRVRAVVGARSTSVKLVVYQVRPDGAFPNPTHTGSSLSW
jgi:hypothetical protein